jgi:molybdenum-dependent DNA-binding transcriptional regulator ModE
METITMTSREQRRAKVLAEVAENRVTVEAAAVQLKLSVRQVWRLLAAVRALGPAGLVHGNRGRPSARRTDDALRTAVLELLRGPYRDVNDSHAVELLAELHGLVIARETLRGIRRAAGLGSPRRRRPPRHRARRERMPAAGMLVQLDGSRHPWLEERGPWLTLLGAVDDATGELLAATFRDQEDAAGYFEVLRTIVSGHGLPDAVYRDRHGVFEPTNAVRGSDPDEPEVRLSQVGRALVELDITSIAAASPQAKGRIERLWGTLQDRLVVALRLAGAADRAAANAVLEEFVPRFNRRFGVPAARPEPAWRPVPAGLDLERVFAFKYRRRIARHHPCRQARRGAHPPRRLDRRVRWGARARRGGRPDERPAAPGRPPPAGRAVAHAGAGESPLDAPERSSVEPDGDVPFTEYRLTDSFGSCPDRVTRQ